MIVIKCHHYQCSYRMSSSNTMDELTAWQQKRAELSRKIDDLRRKGICYTCYDLQTDGQLFGNEYTIYEDDLFKVVLEPYPRTKGHTIVIYKPHRSDLSELSDNEAGKVFAMCVRVVQSIKASLGAEKVYLNTMCDGDINHLHLQLFPRYPRETIGSNRFVAERHPVSEAKDTVRLIRLKLQLPDSR